MTLGRPGDLLADRYRLDRFVSGAGRVERWRAFDERLARPVTARLEPAAAEGDGPEEAETPAVRAALTNIAQLNHPGVAAVYDVGTADGLRGGATVGYAISEWTEGRTLGQIMATGPQPWPRTAHWGRQISGALAALHGIGIAHGSLSPQSVAIHDDRQVKILDVGLDSDAADGGDAVQPSGTQDSDSDAGEERDAAALPAGAPDDVYALGFLLWEATVGAAPEYVIPAAGGDEEAAAQVPARTGAKACAGTAAEAAPTNTAATLTQPVARPEDMAGAASESSGVQPSAAGIDQRPLLELGAPAEFAALLAQMLSGDPASRPTAAEAERLFEPFAHVERAADTLPGVAAAAVADARTQVLGPPITGATAGAAAGAAAAEAALAERDRRRGAMLGLVLLIAAVLAGLGFLLANLNSRAGSPSVVNTVIPSNSPGMVTLPNGSLSPAPSVTPTKAGQPTGFAPSTSASATSTSQPSSSPTPSTSASSVQSSSPASASSSASPPTGSGGGGATATSSAPSNPGGSSSTPSQGLVHTQAATTN